MFGGGGGRRGNNHNDTNGGGSNNTGSSPSGSSSSSLSQLIGGGGGFQQQPENASSNTNNSNITGFNPELFERAAKAARELDNSRNANAAIELVKSQEITKQHEAAAKRSEMDAYTAQLRQQNIKDEGEQARKTLEQQTQHDKYRTEYRDELERKRQVDMLNAQKYMQDEQLKKQEEMTIRQEDMKRKTAQLEAELRTKTEIAKTKAESEGKIIQERTNHDLMIEKLRLEASERRDTILQAIHDGGIMIGNGIRGYLNDGDQLRNTVTTVTGIAVGVYTARTSINIVGRYIESRLGKPTLIRETSRINTLQYIRKPWTLVLNPMMKRFFSTFPKKVDDDALKGIVLKDDLDLQLRKIAISTSNTKKNNAPFRHLLLHGPPGTGKTMFAKQLAKVSGLDYAICTGGDIAPLGRDAVTELHKLFDWATYSSNRGLLLFIDEADAFLKSRSIITTGGGSSSADIVSPEQQQQQASSSSPSTSIGEVNDNNSNNAITTSTTVSSGGNNNVLPSMMSEDVRNALNAFLYRTGTESNQFMMIYASNQPEQLDVAILDRIDEMIYFDLPELQERKQMIIQYMDEYLLHPKNRYTKRVTIADDVIDTVIHDIAIQTDGFSGRSISKLVIAWQSAAYGTTNCILDKQTMLNTVQQHKRNMHIKELWRLGKTT